MSAVQQQKRRQEEQSMWEEAYNKPGELVQEYPATATLVAFGIGVGVGVLIGHTIIEAMTDRTPVTSTAKMQDYGRHLCENVKNAITESIERHWPKSMG